MKKYLITFSLLLFLPAFVFAADSAILNTDVILTVGSENVTVSGGNATIDTIVINGDSTFNLTLSEGQSIQVTSSNRRIITATQVGSIRLLSMGCGTSDSVYKIENPTGGVTATTVVTVPTTGTCSGGGSGGGGGSSGGGGGSYAPQVVTTTPTPTPTTTTTTTSVPTTTGGTTTTTTTTTFTGVITIGTTSSEVKQLQQFLNSDPDTKIASSGAGSPGNETNYFGSLTTQAVQKFQEKYGIATAGDPGYGLVGPKTKAKLNELMGASTSSTAPTTTGGTTTTTTTTFTSVMTLGTTNSEVKQLQRFLNSDPDTKIASIGAGSPGNETNYFGSLTVEAVQKFQEKYGIATAGDPGYGLVGPKTKAKLNELMGVSSTTTTTQSTTSSTGPSATEASLQSQLQALQTQLQTMLDELKVKQAQ